jgi:AraC-like DNA-binding protein
MECYNSDITHINEAANKEKQVKYTCHAGLTEVITPIFHEGVIIAYMQIGQFSVEEGVDFSFIAGKYGLDAEILKTLHKDVKRVSLKELDALLCICDIIIKYFWQEGIIYNNQSLLAVKIENYIEKQIKERIYIEKIEKEFFANKSAMYNFFKKEFGCTPNEYILEKRINEAKRLLTSEKDRNITEISAMCGFFDYNYFIRVFKAKTGITPLKYRKEKGN